MAVEIVPSVLAHRPKELLIRFQRAEALAKTVHLDIMDGRFVSIRSIGQVTVAKLQPRRAIEIHLMTWQPERWLPVILHLRIQRVILHLELGRRLAPLIALYRSHRRAVIVAVRPSTPLRRLAPWVRHVQGVMIMGVHPGRYHAPFQTKTIDRLRTIHRRYPRLELSCDGGVNPETVTAIVRSGARRLIVGSYLALQPEPKQAWHELRQLVRSAKQ